MSAAAEAGSSTAAFDTTEIDPLMPSRGRPRPARKRRRGARAEGKPNDLARWLACHVLATRASVHSIEMFFPRSLSYAVRQHILTQLRDLHDPYRVDDPRRSIWFEDSVYDGVLQGFRLIVNQPYPLLPVLDQLAAEHGATVARV